jgi:endonuclease/exonuclease/phosphatase family metal-dependent hydrolase
MNRLAFFVTVTLGLIGIAPTATGVSSAIPVRVMTYNIHHGEGVDETYDLPRIAGVIARARPDLVALQEVDEANERSGGVRQMRELGRLTGLHPVFGQAMPYRGGGYGVGILSRWPPMSVRNQPLPGAPDREPRTLLSVTVRPGRHAPTIVFSSTHLDFGRGDGRNAQARAINDALTADDGQLSILGGDLNSGDDSDVLQTMHQRWSEISAAGATSLDGSGRPIYRLDYLFTRPATRWRVVEAHVIDTTKASDHFPVLAVVNLFDGAHR